MYSTFFPYRIYVIVNLKWKPKWFCMGINLINVKSADYGKTLFIIGYFIHLIEDVKAIFPRLHNEHCDKYFVATICRCFFKYQRSFVRLTELMNYSFCRSKLDAFYSFSLDRHRSGAEPFYFYYRKLVDKPYFFAVFQTIAINFQKVAPFLQLSLLKVHRIPTYVATQSSIITSKGNVLRPSESEN